ncbi:MAG: enolase C-terminal domain-like protein, partial [Halofilum sp. (in: g-proteobacteria)]
MKIERVDSYTNHFVGVVRVTCDDGSVGWGQMAPYNADISATVLHRQVAPHAIGRDAGDIDRLVDLIGEREHKFPGTYLCRALAGLDTALWDLHGRRQDRSVCELLGGRPGAVPVYASSMRRDISADDEAGRLAAMRERQGFRAFKVRVGSECGHDADEWPGRTEAVVAACRRALGDDARLLVDANSC